MKWSHIIVIVMTLFIIMIVTMAVKMGQSKIELYESDYYQQGEDYAQRMEEEEAAKSIVCKFSYETNSLKLHFQNKQGQVNRIKCIKLSDATADFVVNRDARLISELDVPLNLTKGIWVVEVYGKLDNKKFFKKLELTL